MALMKMPCAVGSGGGNIKSGVCDDTTSAGEEIRIDTGLSSIEWFVLTGLRADESNYYHRVFYWKGNSNYYLSVMDYASSSYYGGITTVGSYPSGTYGATCTKLTSINNGTVILNTATMGVYGKMKNIQWSAG